MISCEGVASRKYPDSAAPRFQVVLNTRVVTWKCGREEVSVCYSTGFRTDNFAAGLEDHQRNVSVPVP